MTQTEFFEQLSRSRRKWVLSGNYIRAVTKPNTVGFCPITAVALTVTGKKFNMCDHREAAIALKMSTATARKIVNAADRRITFDPKLREKLLTACKLEENKWNQNDLKSTEAK